MDKSGKAALIRRFIAIGLTALTLVFLFWPSMMGYTNKESRKNAEDNIPIVRSTLSDMRSNKDEYIEDAQEEFGSSDGKALYDAAVAYLETQTMLDWSFLSMRTATTSQWTVARIQIEHYNTTLDSKDQERYDKNIMYSILMNITFFGILAAGVLAILLYALNKSRAGGIVLAVFTVIGAAVFVAFLIYQNGLQSDTLNEMRTYMGSDYGKNLENPFGPGPALFLLPAFAIAACIVYQRSPKPSGASAKPSSASADAFAGDLWGMPPASGAAGTPAANPTESRRADQGGASPRSSLKMSNNWSRPGSVPTGTAAAGAPNRTPARVSVNGWICPQCESDNPASEEFCPLCGGKKPAVRNEAKACCTACGAPILPGALFCTTCGAKQR